MNVIALLIPLIALLQPATPKFSAKLYAADESVRPGGKTELAIELNVEKGWHIYHPIILDTGAPTKIEFTAPAGVTIGPLRFPTPKLRVEVGLEYLALSGKVLVLAPVQVAADVAPGPITIKAAVDALACKELCLPVQAEAELKLNVSPEPAKAANAELFKDAREKLVPPLATAKYIDGSRLLVTQTKVPVGGSAELVAVIRVQADHYVLDHEASGKDLTPARLFIEPRDGIKIEKERETWPKPRTEQVPGVGDVRAQAGGVVIRVPFAIDDEKFEPGPVRLGVLFQYQAGKDGTKPEAPLMAEGAVEFEVVPAGAPAVANSDPLVASLPPLPAATTEPANGGQSPATRPKEATGENGGETGIPTKADWTGHIPWQKWQPGLPEELAKSGHLVYVDYTATWCLTCQSNKTLVLETEAVREKMRDLGVVPILADYTNQAPQMRAEITRWAPTVPLNLVYAPGHPERPAVLPTVLTRREVFRALADPLAYEPPAEQNLWLALLTGFLGGLILNVMPCVLPVISIKILSFVQQAGEDPKRVFRLGLAFCAGIMVWFWAFAALSTVGRLPWQYPEVVVGLGSILFVFSLSLFGVFEVFLPSTAAGKMDALAAREGYPGAFAKGLLATLLGTACTAPFLAGAMAYALTQPGWIVFLVFSSAGVGMAAPYLILSAKPGWLRFVPKPGPWMVTFKQATGFVLLATVVWLLWILAHQIDALGVVWTAAFWGFLALSTWLLGRIRPNWETGSRIATWAAAFAIAALGFYFCYFVMYSWSSHGSAATAAVSALPASTG